MYVLCNFEQNSPQFWSIFPIHPAFLCFLPSWFVYPRVLILCSIQFWSEFIAVLVLVLCSYVLCSIPFRLVFPRVLVCVPNFFVFFFFANLLQFWSMSPTFLIWIPCSFDPSLFRSFFFLCFVKFCSEFPAVPICMPNSFSLLSFYFLNTVLSGTHFKSLLLSMTV
jgi:hypothetical protein